MVLGLASEPGVKKPAAGVAAHRCSLLSQHPGRILGPGRVSKWACPWRGRGRGRGLAGFGFFRNESMSQLIPALKAALSAKMSSPAAEASLSWT